MNRLINSALSVAARTSPNLVLLIILTNNYSLSIVSDTLFAITICTIMAAFVDYGLNDKFNVRCASDDVSFQLVFQDYAVFRVFNFLFLMIPLLIFVPIFMEKKVFFLCLLYLPLATIFLIQNLVMGVTRYKKSFNKERELQFTHSALNLLGMIAVQLVFSPSIEVFLIDLIVLRLILLVWLCRAVSLRKFEGMLINNLKNHFLLLKQNFYWFSSHGLAILYLNVDILILSQIMNAGDFAAYQILIRFFLTMTMLSMAASPILAKDFQVFIGYFNTNVFNRVFKIISKMMIPFVGIALISIFVLPHFLTWILNLELTTSQQPVISLLCFFFLLRVSANFYNVAYAAFDLYRLKFFSILFSIIFLTLGLLVTNPENLSSALIILVMTSILSLLFHHVSLQIALKRMEKADAL